MIHTWSKPQQGFFMCFHCLCRVRMTFGPRGGVRLEFLPARVSGWENAGHRAPACTGDPKVGATKGAGRGRSARRRG